MGSESGARNFFKQNVKSGIESVSGYGSFLRNTNEIRRALPEIFKKYQIESMLDCPCGDWNWMSKVDLDGIFYVGVDVVSEVIERNRVKFEKKGIKFGKFDIIKEVPLYSDLILCRDFLFHLSLKDMRDVVENFRRSGSTYLLTTTFPEVKRNYELSEDELIAEWGYRNINVEIEPINLRDPLESIQENHECKNRQIRMYKIN